MTVGEAFWQPLVTGGDGQPGAGLATFDLVDQAAPNTLYVNGEEAVYDSASDRTFYAWLGAGRDLYVGQYDHATGINSAPVFVDTYVGADTDDHGAPSIVVTAAGTILIAWGTVSAAGSIYLSRSDNPRDISAWSTSTLGPSTVYPTLIVAPNGDVLLFAFAGSGATGVKRWAVRTSSDDGVTFGSSTDIIDTTGVVTNPIAYVFPMTLMPDGLIHMTWTVGDYVALTRTNLYHATYDTADGTMRNLDGDNLGTTITSGEHASCLAFTGSNVHAFQHTIADDGRVFIPFNFGTDGVGELGTYTANVSTWDGTAWSNVDTGAANTWRYSDHQIVPYKDGLLGLFCERTGTFTDVALWVSPDGADWWRAGVVLEGDTGEGYASVMKPNGGGPILAVAEQMPAGFSRDPADGMAPLRVVWRPASLDQHTHDGDYEPAGAVAEHNADPAAHPDLAVQNETIFAPEYTVTDGTTLDLDITFVWGIDAGDPYYNVAGVTAGDEAVLVLNNDTGELTLRPVEV